MLFLFVAQTRNRFDGTRSEVEELMKKIRKNPLEHKRASPFTMEGYLYVQEKRKSWIATHNNTFNITIYDFTS